MSRVSVERYIDAGPEQVWDAVADIATHTRWMADAVAIRFTSESRSGVGTTFDCDTRLGPFRLTDRMEVTEWDQGRVMGIRHVGAVTGTGRFTLAPQGSGTRFSWTEELTFPRWMGGSVAGVVTRGALAWVWRRNLDRLAALVEARR